jgi:hypothetical protein
MNIRTILLAAALAASAPAAAQSAGGFMLGITGGTLGIGPEATYRMSETVGLRANGTFFNFDRDVDSSDVTYNGKLKLQSFGAMVDVHPFGGSFRISGGARIGNNKVRLRATPTQNVEVGDETYTPAQIGTLSGDVEANDFAPTLTLGWAGGLTPGVKLGIEAGAMFQGSPKVRNLRASGSFASNPALLASLAEEQREIEDDIDGFKVYPVLQIALGYRF